MAVLDIRKAQREGARLVIGLAGVSGSGKTVSAIMLAYGLANYDPSKIGFIDTENRRGSLNADVLRTATPPTNVPFLIGDLVAPFSPARYIEAIHEFQKSGVEVLIVDSGTHEWEGVGGCLEIAGADNKRWNLAKAEHKRFLNALLQCDMHVILCLRAREKVEIGKNAAGKAEYTDAGLQPITEKNLMFEMTASMMMHDEGKRQETLKCPGALINILGRREGYLTPADGKAVRDWVDGAKQLDPTVEKFRNRLLSNCEGGKVHIEECWSKTPAAVRESLGEGFHQQIVASASAYDAAKAAEPEVPPADASNPAEEIRKQAEKGAAARRSAPPAAAQPTPATPAPAAVPPPQAAPAPVQAAPAPAPEPEKPAAPPPQAAKPPAATLEEPMF